MEMNDLLLLFFWISWSILLSIAGNHRTIGRWETLLLSLVFSPLAGAVGVALSQRAVTKEYNKSHIDEMNRIQNAWDKREISQEEYNQKMQELQNH